MDSSGDSDRFRKRSMLFSGKVLNRIEGYEKVTA